MNTEEWRLVYFAVLLLGILSIVAMCTMIVLVSERMNDPAVVRPVACLLAILFIALEALCWLTFYAVLVFAIVGFTSLQA